jgi:creatinine amidohydrolase
MTRLRELSWPEARDALRDRVVLLPVGSVEQHGRHMPLATDHVTAEEIALRAEERHELVVAPTLPYGVSPHHRQFWGTCSVRSELFRDFVLDIARSLAGHGVNRIVVVNGHGGNSAALGEVAQTLRSEGVAVALFAWWHGLDDPSIRELLGEKAASITGHACAVETSVGLHLFPQWVRHEEAIDVPVEWAPGVGGGQVHFDSIDFSPHGNIGYPTLARREAGEALIEQAVLNLIELVRWLESHPLSELLARPHAD